MSYNTSTYATFAIYMQPSICATQSSIMWYCTYASVLTLYNF